MKKRGKKVIAPSPPFDPRPSRRSRTSLAWDVKLILIGAAVGLAILGVGPFVIAGYVIWRVFQ